MRNLKEDILKIIKSSVSAPSGDNLQPWEFKINNNYIEIGISKIDDDNLIFGSTPVLLSHGTLIENIVIAADHCGYSTTVELFPTPDNKKHTANIKLDYSPIDREVDLFRFLRTRSTDRSKYLPETLSSDVKKTLAKAAESLDASFKFKVIDNRKNIAILAKCVASQIEFYFTNKTFHKLFFKNIRWGEKDFKNIKDGLYIKSLRLNIIDAFFLKNLLSHWKIVSLLNKVGIHKILSRSSYNTYKSGGSYCALTISKKDVSPEKIITAGRSLQRTWLEATKQGLSVQPASAFILINESIKEGNFSATSKEHDFILKNVMSAKNLYRLSDNEEILWIFRAGKSVNIKRPLRLRKEPLITFSKQT